MMLHRLSGNWPTTGPTLAQKALGRDDKTPPNRPTNSAACVCLRSSTRSRITASSFCGTAKGQGHRSEDDIIHRPAAVVLDCLDVGQRNLSPGELLWAAADGVEGQPLYRSSQFRYQANDLSRSICRIRHSLRGDVEQSRMQSERSGDQRQVRLGQPA